MIHFFLLILSLLFSESEHDFHVSRLTMDYQSEERQFEVALHVFTDDLELALRERGAPDPKLNTKSEWKDAEAKIQSYLSDVLQLKTVAGTNVIFEYLGKESSDDYMATWIYFYWKLPSDENHFILKHRLFYEIYDDQQNILKVKGCQPEGLKLLTSQDSNVEIKCKG